MNQETGSLHSKFYYNVFNILNIKPFLAFVIIHKMNTHYGTSVNMVARSYDSSTVRNGINNLALKLAWMQQVECHIKQQLGKVHFGFHLLDCIHQAALRAYMAES